MRNVVTFVASPRPKWASRPLSPIQECCPVIVRICQNALRANVRQNFYFRPDAEPIRSLAHQINFQPVVRIAVVPVEQIPLCRRVPARDVKVQESVVVVVAPSDGCGASSLMYRTARRNSREGSIMIIVKQRAPARVVALAFVVPDIEVQPTVIVVVTPR